MNEPARRGTPDPKGRKLRPHDGPADDGLRVSDLDANRFLLGRSTDEPEKSRRKGKNLLRFKIQHLMYLTVWTAMLLSIREPLMASVPELVSAIVWVSAIAAVAMTAGVYGIALMMDEGLSKDNLVRRILYFLCADMLLLFIFTILDKRK